MDALATSDDAEEKRKDKGREISRWLMLIVPSCQKRIAGLSITSITAGEYESVANAFTLPIGKCTYDILNYFSEMGLLYPESETLLWL